MATGAISLSASSSLSPRRTVAYQGMWTTPAMGSGPHFRADRARALGGAALSLLGGADEDRDLAEVLVVAQELVRLGDALERHRLPQHGADLALDDQAVGAQGLPRVGEVGAEDLLLAHPEVADVEVQ